MKKKRIFWRVAVPCGLLIVFAWLRFIEQRTFSAGLAWAFSLLLSFVPVIAANMSKSE